MNSLTLLARRYDARALSSVASTSRSSPPSPDSRTSRRSRRTFSFSSASHPPTRPVQAKRPASSPSTPARLSTPLLEIPPPLPFPSRSLSAPAVVQVRHRFLAQCYPIVRRAMQEVLIWAIPTAARAVKHVAMDGEDKVVTADETGSEDGGDGSIEEIKLISDSHDQAPTSILSLSPGNLSLSPGSVDVPTLLIETVESPPIPPSPTSSVAVIDVTPPTPVNETTSRSLASSFGISPLRLFQGSSTTVSKSQSLLPNPLSVSLLTSSPAPQASSRRRSSTTVSHFPPKKTLVLDLDETLIHSTSHPLSFATGGTGVLGLGGLFGKRSHGAGHMVEVILNGRSMLYHVYKRPFVDYFLRKVSGWYTLVIFTASMQEYADPVIDWLDGGRGLFSRRFFRESCTQQQGGSYSKDLALVDEDLRRICLIDNSPISYSNHPANGIPIEGWISDPSDEALLDLLPVLDSLRFATDVRRILGIRGF